LKAAPAPHELIDVPTEMTLIGRRVAYQRAG